MASRWQTPQSLNHLSIRSAQPLTGGLSNRCWRITLENDALRPHSLHVSNTWVWRPNSDFIDAVGVDRQREASILRQLSQTNLAPSCGLNTDEGILAEFIEGSEIDPVSMPDAMALLARIHAHTVNLDAFNPHQHAAHYWQHIAQASETMQVLRRQFDQRDATPQYELALCHFDFGAYNVIDTGNGLVAIDWEYAALACPALDLAMTISIYPAQKMPLIVSYAKAAGLDDSHLILAVEYWQPWCDYLAMLWYQIAGEHADDSVSLDVAAQIAERLMN